MLSIIQGTHSTFWIWGNQPNIASFQTIFLTIHLHFLLTTGIEILKMFWKIEDSLHKEFLNITLTYIIITADNKVPLWEMPGRYLDSWGNISKERAEQQEGCFTLHQVGDNICKRRSTSNDACQAHIKLLGGTFRMNLLLSSSCEIG